jgi:quercetin dioxygenase-like cupin family protein
MDGPEIGADLIEMQPGSAFPLHIHPGEHILYVIQGQGLVHVDGVDQRVKTGDTIFIPAEYPHAVKTISTATEPFLILAVGYPHKHIDATDRMKIIKEEED